MPRAARETAEAEKLVPIVPKDVVADDPTMYNSDDIEILEGVEAIRRRPGMYIGGRSTSGLLHLLTEALDNCLDEANEGFGEQIWIVIDKDNRVTVRDEARGIPFEMKEHRGKLLPAATIVMTVPHSGGKFREGVYKSAGGLHGVGATAISALSRELKLTIWRDGKCFTQLFEQGIAKDYEIRPTDPNRHGTELCWLFDDTIFETGISYLSEIDTITSRLQAAAFLHRGIQIHFEYWDTEAEAPVRKTFSSKEGLSEYVRTLLADDVRPLFKQPIAVSGKRDAVEVDVALQPNHGFKTFILSFANGIKTRDGGFHESGFRAALTRVVNDYALKWGIIKSREKESFKPEVIQQGLIAVVTVRLPEPQFQGQTKDRLLNAPAEGAVRSVVDEGLKEWFEANPNPAREWLKRVQLMQKARNTALIAEELARSGKKGELIDTSVSRKFTGCGTKDPARSELFIVEGDSAGGSAKQGRNPEFQAILTLRGKPLNVARADLAKLSDNEEIRTLRNVLGCGCISAGNFDIAKLRFHKVIIMADADDDGLHIVCLLLTLFYREFTELLEHGHIYIACPPLYSASSRGKMVWLVDEDARRRFVERTKDIGNWEFRRYKGLGEMNAKQLQETTLDPLKRTLRQVSVEDAIAAERVVRELMQDTDASVRRDFLARHARTVTDLLI